MIDTLIAFFHYGFFQRALGAGLVMGLVAPLFGIFFVARRQAFFADTLAHASLAGAAVGLALGSTGVWTTLLGALFAALLLEWLKTRIALSGDAALALILSGSLASAVMILSVTDSWNSQVLGYLFGSITTIGWSEVGVIALIACAAIFMLFMGRGIFFLVATDPNLARVQGISASRYETLFVCIAALVVALGMRMLGALLVSALLVIPVISANMWKKGFWHTALLGSVYGGFSVVLGILCSAVMDLPTGATIILLALFFLALTKVFHRNKTSLLA